MEKSANFTQKSAKILTEIGQYNQKVSDYLASKPLDAITQYAIKQFKDVAQRKKLSVNQYNQAVQEFNDTHGLLLLKKGDNWETPQTPYYSYINYPFLNREAIKSTMDLYRQYVHKYNKRVEEENKEIYKYNKDVQETKNKAVLASIKLFNKQYNKEFVRSYNEEVEEFNAGRNAKYLRKKRIQKVKYATEIVFHVLVGFYTGQLKTRNAYLMELNRSTSVSKNSLPKLKIDHRKLATHNIADIPRLDFCKKTAQNHVKRLREAGILINYLFINQNKPISVNFNPKILQVLDGKPPKSQSTENQFFISSSEKKLHNNNDSITRTLLKEKEIKDCAKSTVDNKCGLMLQSERNRDVCPADGYKNTIEINKEVETTAPKNSAEIRAILPDFLKNTAPKQGVNNTIAENFLSKIQEDQVLANELANGEYNQYKGLRYDYLKKVDQYAGVSNEEFKAVIIQDFIKTSAKIWKNHTVYVGEWKKTINYLNNVLFANITQKETMVRKLVEYRWKLNFARKWFAKNEVNALYPSMYFDNTRTKSNELGFFGLHSAWKSHLKYVEKRSQEQKQQKQNANTRKRRLSAQKKYANAILKYHTGKLSHKKLYDYVQDNLPHNYLLMLSNTLKNNLA